MKTLTKQNIASSRLLHFMPKGTAVRVFSRLLAKIEIDRPYIITISIKRDKICVSYTGAKFGLQELKQETKSTRFGGGGAQVLLDSHRIAYEYKSGCNCWYIEIEDVEIEESFFVEVTGKVNISAANITDKTVKMLRSKDYSRSDSAYVWQYLLEIITNITYNTNIDKTKMFGIVDILKEVRR